MTRDSWRPLKPLDAKPTLLRRLIMLLAAKAVGVGALFIGLIFWAIAFNMQRIENAQHAWEVIPAQVTESRKESSSRSTTCYFSYEYLIDGKVFEGFNYSAKDWDSCEGVDTYALGEKIDIYYDPYQPDDSVAVRESASLFQLVVLWMGALLHIGSGLYAIFLMPYAKANRIYLHLKKSVKVGKTR